MGVRAYSESHKLALKKGGRLPSNYRLQVLYDGVDTNNSGAQQNLSGKELWWDGTGLYRVGLNIGPTFQNLGVVDCEIFAAIAPKEYAQLINTQASLTTLMSSRWKSLGTLSTGQALSTGMYIYSLFRFVFASGTKGEVVAATL